MNSNEEDRLGKPFPITSVSRIDIVALGFSEEDVLGLEDAEMEGVASDMAEAYVGGQYWQDLEIIANRAINDSK